MKMKSTAAPSALIKRLRQDAFSKGLIAPSILSADFSELGNEIKEVEAAGCSWIHVDVMDGHFVPNLTMGPPIVAAIRSKTKSVLDCHLMVSEPERWIEPFAKAGADCITVHSEVSPHLDLLLQQIRQRGILAGISINPATPISAIEDVLDSVDLVLVMSVNPGFGGQSFIPRVKEKIERLVELRKNRNFLIEVDGGINATTIGAVRAAGADVFVAGSAIFASSSRKAAVRKLEKALEEAN